MVNKRLSFLLLIAILLIQGCGILNTDNYKRSYQPLKEGNTWIYQYTNSESTVEVKIIESQSEINGNEYFKISRKYSWGYERFDYARMRNGEYLSYDELTKGESLIIPKNPREGTVWKHFDKSWEYEIISTNADLQTPSGNYSKLLKIRATQLSDRDKDKSQEYHLYFKKGVGKIAGDTNGVLHTYLIDAQTN